MKTKNSIRNLLVAFVCQFFGILVSFVSRILFIKYLGAQYLGIDGLFTNIISLLSLVELGIGPAMSFSLYEPIAKNDKNTIKSIMALYKKLYHAIGCLVLLLGILLLPFYKHLIETVPSIAHLDFIFLLFILNTAVSYFYSYKRTIIICNEKKYITTIIKYACYTLLTVLQIIVLVITKNYILFLILQVLFTFIENKMVSKKADKMYPYLKDKKTKKLSQKKSKEIKNNVFAMVFHKLGGIVVNSTDNIIIAKMVGIISVGINANYLLITNAIVTITNQFFEAIIASVGNIGVKESKEKLLDIFNKAFFFNYWLFSFISCLLLVLINDFITLWIGEEYLFEIGIVFLIVINFYLRGIRKSCLTFRDALGLFWYDRYKPIFECIINLIVSVFLAKYYGVFGIFLGTIISCITTSSWIEPYVLYKYGFKTSVKDYFKRFIIYTTTGILSTFLILKITSFISTVSWMNLIFKTGIVVVLFNGIFVLLFYKTKEFKYYINLIKKIGGVQKHDA